MLALFHRYGRPLLLALLLLLGAALGHLTSTLIGLAITPEPQTLDTAPSVVRSSDKKSRLSDFEIILKRNIFDSSATQHDGFTSTTNEPTALPTASTGHRSDIKLLGTVAAGRHSLAMLNIGRETATYHLEEELPGGGALAEVKRHEVVIRYADGTNQTLQLDESEKKTASTPEGKTARGATTNTASSFREVGGNRWVVPREEVEKARSNLNDLLKQARMEPNIVNGRTDGFAVKMIRPNSLLAMLGIRKGDVVKQVNDLSLDSPEKALQIFQQLREARQISIGLERGGSPMTFQYDLE
ncbi:MAG: hypothetical protein C0621_02155 [Desulfuromonas sp.]|nr:MAG: hypothetical protein C0621_02155 [Desulfuromonas sp.]